MRQLIKFCLVGASSTVIDLSIFAFLLHLSHGDYWWLARAVSFIFGVTNGFIWNRRWTFKGQGLDSSRQQYSKFVATNFIGLILNLLITKGFLVLFTGQVVHNPATHPNAPVLASLCAVPIVVIWNFAAARFWTFRAPKTTTSSLS